MKHDTALCVYLSIESEFAHIKGYCVKSELNADGQPVYVDRYDHPLHNLKLHSQCSRDMGEKGLYAMSVEWDCYDRINMRDAKKAYETLAPIEKRMAKMNDIEGYPKSYGQWLNRVARAIGAKTVFFKRSKAVWNGSQYVGITNGDIVHYGDSMENEVKEWANPSLKAA
jgi:hypothetical protein